MFTKRLFLVFIPLCMIFGAATLQIPLKPQINSPFDVNLSSGTFRGVGNRNGTDAWLGIPFAQPPIGNLRFKAPQRIVERRQGIQDASRFGDACPQLPSSTLGANMSENCLFLNVWRPTGMSARARLPVMVWFHGGRYTSGSVFNLPAYVSFTYSANSAASDPAFNPTRIVKLSVKIGKPIVFVSLNYRLNTFGFLASAHVPLEDLNAGLLDQKVALEFVQENIAHFGGDSSKVTIWGESAGGGSVEAHMLYGTDDSLFRAVIADSSTGPFKNAPYAWQYDKPGMPYSRLLVETGCPTGPGSVACLQQVPYETLLNVSNAMIESIPTFNGQLWEPAIGPIGSFASERPSARISSGKFIRVPYLSGTNLNEGTLASRGLYGLGLPPSGQTSAFEGWLRELVVDDSTLTPSVIAGIESFYPVNDSTYGGQWHTGDMLFDRAGAFYTDIVYLAPRRFLFDHAASSQPMWAYHFTEFIPGRCPTFGVDHMSELLMLFGPVPDEVEIGFADLMTDYWITFVHNMNPGPTWPRYEVTSRQVMQLMRDNVTIVSDDFNVARTDYLNSPPVLAAFEK